jgi:hypothetical protein
MHLSTECVCAGRRGRHTEDDLSDPGYLYGRPTLLDELGQSGCLSLRTSIIGWKLKHWPGLFGLLGFGSWALPACTMCRAEHVGIEDHLRSLAAALLAITKYSDISRTFC